jgi:putative DNA primase/helicase
VTDDRQYPDAMRIVADAERDGVHPDPYAILGLNRSGKPPAAEPKRTDAHHGQLRFAQRFANLYGGKYLHAHGIGWHLWDGRRWSPDRDGAPMRAVKKVLETAYGDLANLEGDARKALFQEIGRCSSSGAMHGILDLAGHLHPCTIAADRLDIQPTLFNTLSGTLDLATGQIHPHRSHDLMTKVAGATFDPEATCDVWDRFLKTVLPDEDVRAFVQRLIGYSMLGGVREHIMPIFTGTGQNGKGTLRDAIKAAFGDYVIEVDPELLMESRNPRHLTFLMELKARRLVFCSETEKGRKFAESTMKRLVGGDPIQANRMHRDPVTFDPTHTLIMMTNHLPQVSGDDPAVWRRLLVVPFDVVIPEEDRDPGLPERLREPDVRVAVLAWAWRGYLDYQQLGLAPPEAVTVRTDAYRQDSDDMGHFVGDEMVFGPAQCVTAKALYERYERWCRENGVPAMTKTAFGKDMASRSYRSEKAGGGRQVYRGVGLVVREEESSVEWAA